MTETATRGGWVRSISSLSVKPASARENNFDALRLAAAMTILVLHSWPIAGREVVPRVHGLGLNGVAVMVFFSISGFLLAQSWTIEPDLRRFLAKRALRIYPALIVVLVLTTFVLGPAVTTLGVADYLGHPQTWRYIGQNLVFDTQYHLPGVFGDNPIPGGVNGPLWTLSPEVRSYLILAVLGVAGVVSRRLPLALFVGALLVLPQLYPGAAHDAVVAPLYVQCFFVAALLYRWRARVPWHGLIALAALVAFLVGGGLEAGNFRMTLIDALAIPYLTVYLAYHSPGAIRRVTDRGDLSYGIYIFASPVQETIEHVWGSSLAPLGLLALALPTTLLFALGSWVAVERPALRFKARRVTRRQMRSDVESTTSAPGRPYARPLEPAPEASAGPR